MTNTRLPSQPGAGSETPLHPIAQSVGLLLDAKEVGPGDASSHLALGWAGLHLFGKGGCGVVKDEINGCHGPPRPQDTHRMPFNNTMTSNI